MTIELPRDIRERARVVAKRTRLATVDLIREGLREKVEFYEAKFREEEQRKRDEKLQRRGLIGLQGLRVAPPSPLAPTAAPSPGDNEPDEETDALAALYASHAKELLAVVDGPILQRRLAVAEAIADIKRRAPLTHPGDEEIQRKLERCIVVLKQEQGPTPPSVLPPPMTPLEVVEEKVAEVAAHVMDRIAGRPVNTTKTQIAGETPKAEGK